MINWIKSNIIWLLMVENHSFGGQRRTDIVLN